MSKIDFEDVFRVDSRNLVALLAWVYKFGLESFVAMDREWNCWCKRKQKKPSALDNQICPLFRHARELCLQSPVKKSLLKSYQIQIKLNHTLILKALLKPDAKNPPNGPMTELKMLSDSEWSTNGGILKIDSKFPYRRDRKNSKKS